MRLLRAATTAVCLTLVGTSAGAHGPGSPPDRWSTEEVSFRSADGIQLSGSFIAPRDSRAVAAVVIGPGAVPGERYVNLAALMALRGIAVLTYDKRGAGKSEGTFERTDNVSAANLELLASDAAAAMRWVSGNSQLRSLPRGFVAISHSGWVIPIALARSPSVDFIGFWSGPACTTSEQLHFQAFSARFEADPNGMSADAIREAMRHVKYRPDDVDPVDRLKAISIPALWLFGGRDPYVPVELSTRRLQDLIDKGRANFQYQVFPEEGHNLADSPEQASFIATVDWINRIASSRTRAC